MHSAFPSGCNLEVAFSLPLLAGLSVYKPFASHVIASDRFALDACETLLQPLIADFRIDFAKILHRPDALERQLHDSERSHWLGLAARVSLAEKLIAELIELLFERGLQCDGEG